jgi:hypothetical protein
MKSAIIMYDPIHECYVQFLSKAAVSNFLWGAKNRTQALDRYLLHVDGKEPLAFKGLLLFYYPGNLPVGASPISMDKYYKLINGDRYIHQL